ncbi:uncharacterized protein LOC119178056 isoform X4 [Rhipicephalus microplus]|uniref:uncharacterized protein LOC119178056 isoform X4 n=1 Tax=Rhipicephalus microplus TaxID=6941 RepID=UPI003F6A77CD
MRICGTCSPPARNRAAMSAELAQQSKLSAAREQSNLLGSLLETEAIINVDDLRNTPASSSERLLSGLVERLRSSKDVSVLTSGANILAAAAKSKDFSSNTKCLQLWLRATKDLVTKEEAGVDALRAIIQCLHVLTPGSASMSDWCQIGLQCLLYPEVRMEAYAALCSQRKAALTPPRRGVDAPAYVAIKDCIGPQLSHWMDGSQCCEALRVWTLIVQWMGEYLPQNAASVNVLLRVASKGLAASSRPELQRQALESWQALISTFKPETLRVNKMLNLVMTPLRQRSSADPFARLALVRTLWHLAVKLGPQHLSTCFQLVGVPMVKTLVGFFLESNTVLENKHDHDNLRRECFYVLLRLLQLPLERAWKTTMDNVPLPPLESSFGTGFLGRHLEILEPACRAAIGFIQQCTDYAPDLGCLLMHLLLKHAAEAHSTDSVPAAAALLKLVLDGLSDWILVAPLACKTILLEASELPEKMLTSHCYYSGKLGLLHGTPVLSLLRLLLQPSLLAVFCSTDEVMQLFQRLLTLGLQNPSRLHLAQSVLSCLERCPPAPSLASSLWTVLASSLLTFLQSGHEVNQGSDLEPDFSALVAALAFPIHHALPHVGAKVRKAMSRRWLQLYQAFSCSAVLVPNVSPQGVCHEVCRRLYAGLNDQLKQDIGYVDAVSELLASVSSCLPSSQPNTSGLSPSNLSASPSSPRRWGSRQQRGSALGNLQPYCQALAWVLDAVASHQLLPNESRQSVASIVGKLVRPMQGLLSSLHSMPALVEVVTLLGPALSKLLVRGSGYTSKVEPVWASLCSALSSQCTSCPRDDSLLCALTPLLEVALGYSRGQVHDRAVHLWQSLFARSPSLHVQPRLRELLRKVKPSLVPEDSEICEPASFSQEFVKVVSPVKRKQVLTEHQKEVRKERRSFPALYSNLSQSGGIDSQDSETPQESEEMDDEPFTGGKRQTLEPMPVIVLDSDSEDNGMALEDLPSVAQEVCGTPPSLLHPSNTATNGDDVVPETQQDSILFTSVETPKSQKPHQRDCPPSNPMSGGSPRVHRPRARLSFTRPPVLEAEECEALGDTDVVPSSQSSVGSIEGVEMAKSGHDKPLVDIHPDSPVTVWLQDKERGRLVASQETLVHKNNGDSPKNLRLTRGSLVANRPIGWQEELLEDGIAPLDDDVPANSAPAEPNVEEHTKEACTTQESTDIEIHEDELEAEDIEPSSPAPANSEECALKLSEAFSACYSEGTVQASQTSPEFGVPILSSENTDRVELAVDSEKPMASACTRVDTHESVPASHSCPDVCTVPETEDQAALESWETKSGTNAASKTELLQKKAVRGSRKRKLPSQTTSPIASRLRAKRARQEQVQWNSSPPPPDAASSRGKPRWSGSSPALSRSRIMLDAAMRSVGSSPSRHADSAPTVPQPNDGGNGANPPLSILKRHPPAEEGSPQGSPHRARQVSSRHVSFADPLVQGEYKIGPRRSRISRALYEQDAEMEEGELSDSQQPLWPPLEGSTEPVEDVLPLLTSSLWQRSLGRKLHILGITTVGALASMTCAQALQLPVRAPRVASLRKALEQYSMPNEEDNPAATIDGETEIICSLSSEPKELAVPMSLQDATTQTDEDAQTTASREVQCCPLVTEDAVQTGLVVMSKEEICQLLTPNFFASLKRAELGRILGIVATVVAQDSQQ